MPSSAALMAQCKASLALSMLLLVKVREGRPAQQAHVMLPAAACVHHTKAGIYWLCCCAHPAAGCASQQEYLKTAYSINSERIEAFSAAGEKKRAEVRRRQRRRRKTCRRLPCCQAPAAVVLL